MNRLNRLNPPISLFLIGNLCILISACSQVPISKQSSAGVQQRTDEFILTIFAARFLSAGLKPGSPLTQMHCNKQQAHGFPDCVSAVTAIFSPSNTDNTCGIGATDVVLLNREAASISWQLSNVGDASYQFRFLPGWGVYLDDNTIDPHEEGIPPSTIKTRAFVTSDLTDLKHKYVPTPDVYSVSKTFKYSILLQWSNDGKAMDDTTKSWNPCTPYDPVIISQG